MPISINTQSVIAFKNLLGKSNTDVGKALGNEAEGIFFNVPSSAVWLDVIDPTPSVAVTAGITVLVTATMVLDNTSNGHGFFATWPVTPPAGTDSHTASPFAYGAGLLTGISAGDRVRNSIPPSFGTGYEAKPFDVSTAAISVGDVRNWMYQYNSGVFFQQDNLGLNPGTIQLYPFLGKTLLNAPAGGGIDWQNPVIDIQSVPPGSPAVGDRYLVGPNASPVPSGAWTGQFDKIAEYTISGWAFTTPGNNFAVRVITNEDSIFFYEGTYPGGMWVKEALSTVRAGIATGTNSYSVTVTPDIEAYETDLVLLLTFLNSNTGAVTLNVNGHGTVNMLKSNGAGGLIPLVTGDIRSSTVYMVVYDGTQFQLFTSAGSGGGGNGTKKIIEPTDIINVGADFQYFIYGDLTVKGEMDNAGEVVIMSGALDLQGTGTFNNTGVLNLVTVANASRYASNFSTVANVPLTIVHNLGTEDFVFTVKQPSNTSPQTYEMIDVEMTIIDVNTITIKTVSNVQGRINIIPL